jgi:peptidoglycan/LPS O-acetylase OafA/YrhL
MGQATSPQRVPSAAAQPLLDVRGHVTPLDGLRGLAVLLVMAHHLINLPASFQAGSVARDLLNAGAWGVDLFFVLSGFLITGILYDARQRPHYFRNFYARRVLRIFPLYYGYLVLYYLFVIHLRAVPFGSDRLPQAAEDLRWSWLYGTNVLIALRGTFVTASLNHFWTLAVEEHFYLLWPLVIYLVPASRLKAACLVVIALAIALRCAMLVAGGPSIAVHVLSPCRMDGFAVGGLLAIAARQSGQPGLWRRVRWTFWLTLPICLLAALGAPRFAWGLWYAQSIGYTVIALFFGALIGLAVGAPARSLRSWCFGAGGMRSLGKYSYGLYVFHHPANIAAERLVPTERLSSALSSAWLGIGCHALAVGVLSILVAWASWHLYEKHFLGLKRFFEGGRESLRLGSVAESGG